MNQHEDPKEVPPEPVSRPMPPEPRDIEFMDRALVLARQAARAGEVPVGAVVYETMTGIVLGEGANQREAQQDPSAHAEVIAIRAAASTLGSWRLHACTLVVTLEPCAMCAGLLVNARVGRLVYGCDDPKAGACGSVLDVVGEPRLNHRVRAIAGVRAAESAELLRAFFRDLRAPRSQASDRGPDAHSSS